MSKIWVEVVAKADSSRQRRVEGRSTHTTSTSTNTQNHDTNSSKSRKKNDLLSKFYTRRFGIVDFLPYICNIERHPQHTHSHIHDIHPHKQTSVFRKLRDIYQTKGDSMTMTEDERRKIGTFRGIDMDINREKLQQMAAEEGIELNFERWDELIRDIRLEESSDSNDSNEKQNDSITKPKFVYNFDGQLIKTFNTTKECAEFFGVSREAVASYSRSERPYYKFGVVITNDLKDDKHKPYVKKRRLWFNDKFNDMFNDKNHIVQSDTKDD